MAVEHDPSSAYDDLNVRSIALVGGVGAVLVFVAIVAVQVIYFRYNDAQYDSKVLAVPTRQANETLLKQRQRIAQAGPGADAEKGEKSIPIAQAMASVVAEYQSRQAAGDAASGEAGGDAATDAAPTEESAAE